MHATAALCDFCGLLTVEAVIWQQLLQAVVISVPEARAATAIGDLFNAGHAASLPAPAVKQVARLHSTKSLNDEAVIISKHLVCVFSQAEDFLVGVRVRTRNSPAGLLLGEIVLGCGPDDLGLPPSAACDVGPTVVYLR